MFFNPNKHAHTTTTRMNIMKHTQITHNNKQTETS